MTVAQQAAADDSRVDVDVDFDFDFDFDDGVPGTAPEGAIAAAVRSGELSGRVWLYSNYHCNLACSYCLTDPRRTANDEP